MEKQIFWIGDSLEELKQFPKDVRHEIGYALHIAQNGIKPDNAKPLPSLVKGGKIVEIRENHNTDTFRAIYTIKFQGVLYVLHAFKKKSNKGIKTPKPDQDLIKTRYQGAIEHYNKNHKKKTTKN